MGEAAIDVRKLAAELSAALSDFRSFCELVEIRTKSEGKIAFAPRRWHEEQRRFDASRTGRDIVLKPRQIGFSTLELVRDLHYALTHPGADVLVVTHDKKLAEQLFEGVRIAAESLRARHLLPRTRRDNVREMVFVKLDSAIRIVEAGETERAGGKKGRSGHIHRLHATEVAFWGAAGATMNSLLGATDEDTEIVVESTANGVGGLFYDLVQAAQAGRGEYRFHFYPWYQHKSYKRPLPPDFDPTPRDAWERRLRAAGCSDQQVAWWRGKVDDPAIGLDKALQEYPESPETCFRAAGRTYLPADAADWLAEQTQAPRKRVPIEWRGRRPEDKPRRLGELLVWGPRDFVKWETRPKGEDYVVAGDVSEGIQLDAHSATVMHRRTAEVVATFWSDSIEAGDFGLAMVAIAKMFGGAEIAPERNNDGKAAIRAITHEAKYGRVYRHREDGKHGWPTTPTTRPVLFDDLQRAVVERAAWTPDAEAAAEARTLIRDKDGKPRARDKGQEGGCKDDRWTSWAIAYQVRSRPGFTPRSLHVKGL